MKYVLSGSLVAAVIAAAPLAFATTIPGIAGVSASPSSTGCFTNDSNTGAVTQNCSDQPAYVWMIPLPTKDGVTTYSPSVTEYEMAVELKPIACAAFTVYPNGTAYQATSWAGGTGSGGTYTLALGSISLPPGGGSMFVECEMKQTNKVYSVTY